MAVLSTLSGGQKAGYGAAAAVAAYAIYKLFLERKKSSNRGERRDGQPLKEADISKRFMTRLKRLLKVVIPEVWCV